MAGGWVGVVGGWWGGVYVGVRGREEREVLRKRAHATQRPQQPALDALDGRKPYTPNPNPAPWRPGSAQTLRPKPHTRTLMTWKGANAMLSLTPLRPPLR